MKTNYSKEDPELHHFYFKQAVLHLLCLYECINLLSKFSNTNLSNPIIVLFKSIDKLVNTNSAYKEAKEFLNELVEQGFLHQDGDIIHGANVLKN